MNDQVAYFIATGFIQKEKFAFNFFKSRRFATFNSNGRLFRYVVEIEPIVL